MAIHTTPIGEICGSNGGGYKKCMFLAVTSCNVADWYPKYAASTLRLLKLFCPEIGVGDKAWGRSG
jgi:hypothetical protein